MLGTQDAGSSLGNPEGNLHPLEMRLLDFFFLGDTEEVESPGAHVCGLSPHLNPLPPRDQTQLLMNGTRRQEVLSACPSPPPGPDHGELCL